VATTDDIIAAVETAQTEIAASLQTLKTDTGVALKSIELVDATTEPPTVKVEVALADQEEAATEGEAEQPGSINEFFGV
jgi:hypothetical protein